MNDIDEFLYELNGRGFLFMDKTMNEFGFNDDLLNMAYEMYQAGKYSARKEENES